MPDFDAERDRTWKALDTVLLAFNNQGTRGKELGKRAKLQARATDLGRSIRFRLDSILVHLDLLYREEQDALAFLSTHLADRTSCKAMLGVAGTRQRYLFDDIAFSAVSAFDYFGNLVGLVHYGEVTPKKWQRLRRYATDADFERKDHASTRIHDSAAASAERELRADWLGEVIEFRTDAIHFRADEVDAHMAIQWEPKPRSVAFHAYVPPEFVRRMKRARLQPPHLAEGASLIPCAEWLAEQTLSGVSRLAEALAQDIGRDPLAERKLGEGIAAP